MGDPFVVMEPVDDPYFKWLCEDLSLHNNKEYWSLLYQLYCKSFYYINNADAKLVDDTLMLRGIYESAWKVVIPEDRDVNVLEVLRYLSMRMSCMIADYSDKEWFWIFMSNLGFEKFDDYNYGMLDASDAVAYRLAVWLTRDFKPNGHGGIFPLSLIRFFLDNKQFINEDQTKLSIYEQAIAYARTECRSVDISIYEEDDTTWDV